MTPSDEPKNITENCVQCRYVIPANSCQQGQLIDDCWYPLHIGCADIWCNEMIPVWTVSHDGIGYTEAHLENVTGVIESMEEDEDLEIKRWSMKRIEYLKLPEFTGF